MTSTKLYLGSDHAGLALKNAILARVRIDYPQIAIEDCGTHDEASCDYPEFARRVADNVVKHGERGILVCGSGTGMAISANKVDGVRANVAWDMTSARLSREHNDSNILCLGARLLGQEVALDVVSIWIKTAFLGGRHQKRVDLIHAIEKGRG
jgi:ribose 5-phosphate isomerase B